MKIEHGQRKGENFKNVTVKKFFRFPANFIERSSTYY